MNGFVQAFQANLHLYEAVGGLLAVAAVSFLLFLLRGTKPYRAYRKPGDRPPQVTEVPPVTR